MLRMTLRMNVQANVHFDHEFRESAQDGQCRAAPCASFLGATLSQNCPAAKDDQGKLPCRSPVRMQAETACESLKACIRPSRDAERTFDEALFAGLCPSFAEHAKSWTTPLQQVTTAHNTVPRLSCSFLAGKAAVFDFVSSFRPGSIAADGLLEARSSSKRIDWVRSCIGRIGPTSTWTSPLRRHC